MKYNFRQGGTWNQGTPKQRENGQWVDIRASAGSGGEGGTRDGGFTWEQTFTDTSWLDDADASGDLNVEKVTTLDYRASGGLEEAVNNADSYPTVVVFEVGGVIELGTNDRFHLGSSGDPGDPGVWVAGETAPYPGITITRGRTRAYKDDVVLTHLTLMQGDEADEDNATIDIDGDDVLIDHCTAAFSTETNIEVPNEIHRASVINTIIAEGLYDNALHDDERARGLLVNDENCTEFTHMGCLYAHTNRRQPMTRSDMVMCNNYSYNFADMQNDGSIMTFNSPGDPDITSVGIHFEPGADTSDDYTREIYNYSADIYQEDMEWDDDQRDLDDGSITYLDDPPLVPPGLDLEDDVMSSADTPEFVKANAGPRPADRSLYEEGLINNRLEGDHGLIDSQDDVGGYPDYTEQTRTLDVPDTGVLDWIQSFTDEVELGT